MPRPENPNRFIDHNGDPIAPSMNGLGPLTYQSDDTTRGAVGYVGMQDCCGPGNVQVSPRAKLVDIRPRSARGQALSVVLGITQIDGSRDQEAVPVDYGVRARVVGGLGAVPFEFECDWLSGTRINVVSETLVVDALFTRYQAPWVGSSDLSDACPPIYQVVAGVGYGEGCGPTHPMRLTELVAISAPGDVQEICIPPFAVSFTIQLAGSASCTWKAKGRSSLFDVEGAIVAPQTNLSQHDTEHAFVQRNGARVIEITNTNTDSPLYGWVIFGLKP